MNTTTETPRDAVWRQFIGWSAASYRDECDELEAVEAALMRLGIDYVGIDVEEESLHLFGVNVEIHATDDEAEAVCERIARDYTVSPCVVDRMPLEGDA